MYYNYCTWSKLIADDELKRGMSENKIIPTLQSTAYNKSESTMISNNSFNNILYMSILHLFIDHQSSLEVLSTYFCQVHAQFWQLLLNERTVQ